MRIEEGLAYAIRSQHNKTAQASSIAQLPEASWRLEALQRLTYSCLDSLHLFNFATMKRGPRPPGGNPWDQGPWINRLPSLISLFELLPLAPNITRLDLGSLNRMTQGQLSLEAKDVQSLMEILPDTQIRWLGLCDNYLDESALLALADGLAKTKLTNLEFSCRGAGGSKLIFLGKGLHNSSMVELNFHSERQYDKDPSLLLPEIETDSVEGLNSLKEGIVHSHVQILRFYNIELGSNGIRVIADLLAESKLETLDLIGGTGIGNEEAILLARALERAPLKKLALQRVAPNANKIGSEGFAALFRALSRSSLEDLSLYEHPLSQLDVEELIRNLPDCSLKKLWIAIDESASPLPLALALANSSLEELHCSLSSMDDEQMDAFIDAVSKSQNLRVIRLSHKGISQENCYKLRERLEKRNIECQFNTPWGNRRGLWD